MQSIGYSAYDKHMASIESMEYGGEVLVHGAVIGE